ncbi:RseA family anti-sigma factor [Vibrio hannami]|uniref:RseA family anti-sigma factor n=1 Tax=Vibrio hannami TaxID=2717094 RepID=UPI00240FA0D5|nr:RseA family anti-sigma factor [Vibrio hannami]MDG3087148.1 RseA family anti-sigma factor [Vibrio hannami]
MVKNMSDKELLSALMDGETVDKALIAELEQNPESQKSWQNYHLIGDVMRGEAPETPSWNIAESVAAALESEPAHSTVTPFVEESQPTPQQAKRHLPSWLTQVGQVAMAACVSLAVILGVQQYGGGEADQTQSEIPVLQTIPVAGSVEPVSLTRESVAPKAQQMNEAQLLEQRRRINAMLQDYELQLRLADDAAKEEIQSVVE